MAVRDCDPAYNLSTVVERVRDLPETVDVALFPEYALTGFVANEAIRDAALAVDGDELDRVRALAAETDVAVLVGHVERRGDDLHNAVTYCPPDGAATTYRKRHLWGDEKSVLTPGTERVVVDTPAGPTGLLTCFDLNFVAESVAHAAEEVRALFVPGAWPAAHSENWRLLLRARALDGVRWVVGAGRTGRGTAGDEPTVYAGRSTVVRPDGAVAAALNRGERDLVVDLDPAVVDEQREFIPALRDSALSTEATKR